MIRTAVAGSRWQARLAGFSRPRRMFLTALLGAIAALGQAPVDLWPLTILGLAGVHFIAMQDSRARAVALTWWAGGAGYFALALSWIVEPFLVDLARHGWMAPFGLVLTAGGMALFWGMGGALARRVVRGSGSGFAVATVISLTLAGVVRGVIFTGFPWALPGHALIGTPALQLAQFGGAMGLSLIVLTLAVCLPLILSPFVRRRALLGLPLWLAAAAAPLLIGAALIPPESASTGRPVVRLVQPNVPQTEKWDREKAPGHFQRMLDLTAAPGEPDLIVWPETAVPAWLNDIDGLLPVISDAAKGRPLVFGINRAERGRVYNSLAVLHDQAGITEVYDKHHLVPFGEFMPLGDLLGRIGIRGIAQRDGYGFTPGPGPRLIDLPGIGASLPLICYEGVFPRNISDAPSRPELLLLITNDAWFGTISGPYQHLAQARLRAVEQGLPMVRVANTGVSALITPAGRLRGRIDLGQPGLSDVALPAALSPTVYARLGDWPFVLALLAALLLLIPLSRRPMFRKGR